MHRASAHQYCAIVFQLSIIRFRRRDFKRKNELNSTLSFRIVTRSHANATHTVNQKPVYNNLIYVALVYCCVCTMFDMLPVILASWSSSLVLLTICLSVCLSAYQSFFACTVQTGCVCVWILFFIKNSLFTIALFCYFTSHFVMFHVLFFGVGWNIYHI